SADLRFRQLGKQLADRREQARVGGRIRSWRAANRALIDVDDLIDVLEPRYAPVRARNHARSVEMPRQRAMQDVLDERRLAGARYTRHGHENAQRDLDVEVAQVVLARALDANHSALVDVASAARRLDLHLTAEILARNRARCLDDVVYGARGNHLAPVLPRPGPEIDDVIRGPHRLFIVLDDNHCVSEISQLH